MDLRHGETKVAPKEESFQLQCREEGKALASTSQLCCCHHIVSTTMDNLSKIAVHHQNDN
ncbi:hypothetical protein M514_23084 [Trichuris suis]|uniref:Uncharacterized protein n=1 Tax=Trichuris suis TaxID=68888 RepID=A0A085N5L5_9BILA|nr:hypothetical protein M514_23084 [Trichuris suis]